MAWAGSGKPAHVWESSAIKGKTLYQLVTPVKCYFSFSLPSLTSLLQKTALNQSTSEPFPFHEDSAWCYTDLTVHYLTATIAKSVYVPHAVAIVLNCTDQDVTQLAMGNLTYWTNKKWKLASPGQNALCSSVSSPDLFVPTTLKDQFRHPSGDYRPFHGKDYKQHFLCALY